MLTGLMRKITLLKRALLCATSLLGAAVGRAASPEISNVDDTAMQLPVPGNTLLPCPFAPDA